MQQNVLELWGYLEQVWNQLKRSSKRVLKQSGDGILEKHCRALDGKVETRQPEEEHSQKNSQAVATYEQIKKDFLF